MKKLFKLIVVLICGILTTIGISSVIAKSSTSYDYATDEEVDVDEAFELVCQSLDACDEKIDMYFDDEFYESAYENGDIDEEQAFYLIKEAVLTLYNDLSYEEKEYLHNLGTYDEEVALFVNLLENDFEEVDDIYAEDLATVVNNAVLMQRYNMSMALTVPPLLYSVGCTKAVVNTINGAYKLIIAAIKAFFVPTSIKAVIVTTAVIALTVTVAYNWDKICQVFDKIVDIFVSSAKNLANVISNAFNKIRCSFSKSAPKSKDPEVQQEIDDLLQDAEYREKQTNGKTTQYEKDGGYEQAEEDFDKLNLDNKGTFTTKDGNEGKSGELKDGTKVSVREYSEEGHPTLEITFANGKKIKIR